MNLWFFYLCHQSIWRRKKSRKGQAEECFWEMKNFCRPSRYWDIKKMVIRSYNFHLYRDSPKSHHLLMNVLLQVSPFIDCFLDTLEYYSLSPSKKRASTKHNKNCSIKMLYRKLWVFIFYILSFHFAFRLRLILTRINGRIKTMKKKKSQGI